MKIFGFGQMPLAGAEGFQIEETTTAQLADIQAMPDDADVAYLTSAAIYGQEGVYEFARLKRSPVVQLRCCCCGGYTKGRQFHNQDTGFGLGTCCVAFVTPRTPEMARTYGTAGVHYAIPDGRAGGQQGEKKPDVYTQVANWHCDGLPSTGLTPEERAAVIESAQGSYLAEHVARTEQELQAMDDKSLIAAHYSAMRDASR